MSTAPAFDPTLFITDDAFFDLPIGLLCVADEDGCFKKVSRGWLNTLGYTEADMLAMQLDELVHPDDLERTLDELEVNRHGSPTFQFENRCRHKNGTYRTLQWSTSPRPSDGAIFAMAWDVTEKLAAEERLRASSAFIHSLVASSPLAIVALDDTGEIQTWNPAAERILGRSPAEAVGRHLEDLLQGTSRTISQLKELLTKKEPFTDFEAFIKRRGVRVDLSVSLSLVYDGHGKRTGLMAILNDISDRKQSERALRELNKTLERRVTERTIELTSANKELEAFCFSVSHDLRGPLRSIDGFSRAVLEDYADKLDDQGQDYLNRVRAATQRLGSLIDSLLALTRLTRSAITIEEVDLSAIVAETLAEYADAHPERNVKVHVRAGAIASGDPRLLRLVMENLLENAWKFTARTPEAEIRFWAEDVDGETVYRVSDNGVGFDMKYVRKLFMPFERLHPSPVYPGNGIGLATVERVVARHGGRVWAEGAEGKGATFSFTLHPSLIKG
jgi:PAS domain S-box-containing protein